MHATVKTEGLNVHDLPDGKVIDALKYGDRVTIVGDPQSTGHVMWYAIRAIEIGLPVSGWVSGQGLHFDEAPRPTPPRPAPPPPVPPVHPPKRDHFDFPAWVWVALGISIVLALLVTFARAT